MAILISYQHQLQFYNTILEKMAVEDTGPLTILTSDGRVTLSGKIMKIFSPLVRDILANMSACGAGQEPLLGQPSRFKVCHSISADGASPERTGHGGWGRERRGGQEKCHHSGREPRTKGEN